MSATNKYLKSSIGDVANFLKNNTRPSEDMYANLLMELKVSNLLLPVVFDGENLSFPHIEVDDGTRLLPLFTSDDELKRYSADFDSISNDISYYIGLVRDLDIDGILIDLESDEFCIERKLLEKIEIPKPSNEGRGLDASELRKLAFDVSNSKLKGFIQDDSNFNNFDELSALLSDSVLLNVVVSDDDLAFLAHDGILSREDVDTFVLYTHQSGRNHYGAVYTDADAVASFHEKLDYSYCIQVTNKYRVFNFFLSGDLDGIVINPGTDEYFVPRQVILRILDDDLASPDFENATRFAFPVSQSQLI